MKKIRYILALSVLLFSCTEKSKSTDQKEEKYTNELINETSPYLLQHAHNPVNWKAWNNNTLDLAKKENKLIVISVGYSACHWCHVMEEESFENDFVAKIMNENFINIKIDREERPDIDKIYMNAVQLITGSGGWPLNCITLPDGRPIFGGTYFTKKQWTKALTELSNLYKNNPEKAIEYAEKLTKGIKNSELITLNKENPIFKKSHIDDAIKTWETQLDYKNGGIGKAPKFPMPSSLDFLLRYSIQNKNPELKSHVETSLERMAYGGIYDQIGGGFSRYSVDEKWHIPHFEKMLYDNAQLVSLYSQAYLTTKNNLYKEVVQETLNFISRKLTNSNGAFYSSIDADSKNANGELEEGAFYVWTEDELKTIITSDYELFKAYYNINSYGFWEKENYVLIKNQSYTEFSKQYKLTEEDLKSKIKNWKAALLEARNKRPQPRLDDKTLTSWNALMLKGYIDAYRVFENPEYLDVAIKNANFIVTKQLKPDGGLYHNYKDGKSTINGYSEDYAAVVQAFIALYEVTLNEKWLNISKELIEYSLVHFFDKESKMFFFTSDEDKNLITRKIEVIDNVIPASNSLIAHSLFKLSHYYSDSSYANKAKQMLNNMSSEIKETPSGYSNWLSLMLNYTNPYFEVAISGENAVEKVKELNQYYLPNILIAGSVTESDLPLMANRYSEDETYIYVCVNGTCRLPETEVEKAIRKIK